MKTKFLLSCVTAAGVASLLSACAVAPSSGPSARGVANAALNDRGDLAIKVIDVDDTVARRLITGIRKDQFSENLGEGVPIGSKISRGDVLDINIWEAPPTVLFGVVGTDSRASSGSRGTTFPEQMVDSEGMIAIPFAGRIQAAGRAPQDISRDITRRLTGKANQPQALVRLTRNTAAAVTVVGDVVVNTRVPLTARGERVLDVLAEAGGAKQPIGKSMVQITRADLTVSMPLELVIRDPRQNIILQPDDVMTVLFQPFSFVALGATGRNEEVPFEATGMNLAQALGRVSGLQDARANVKGVFLFRLEDPAMLSENEQANARLTPDGKVPVIYRFNLKDPATFFVAQSFPIRDRDVLYVSNAPLAEFQKFVNVIYSTVLPVATTVTVTQR